MHSQVAARENKQQEENGRTEERHIANEDEVLLVNVDGIARGESERERAEKAHTTYSPNVT